MPERKMTVRDLKLVEGLTRDAAELNDVDSIPLVSDITHLTKRRSRNVVEARGGYIAPTYHDPDADAFTGGAGTNEDFELK